MIFQIYRFILFNSIHIFHVLYIVWWGTLNFAGEMTDIRCQLMRIYVLCVSNFHEFTKIFRETHDNNDNNAFLFVYCWFPMKVQRFCNIINSHSLVHLSMQHSALANSEFLCQVSSFSNVRSPVSRLLLPILMQISCPFHICSSLPVPFQAISLYLHLRIFFPFKLFTLRMNRGNRVVVGICNLQLK